MKKYECSCIQEVSESEGFYVMNVEGDSFCKEMSLDEFIKVVLESCDVPTNLAETFEYSWCVSVIVTDDNKVYVRREY